MSNVWRSRGYLPHWEAGETAQSITFRLADGLPSAILESWEAELRHLSEDAANTKRRKRIEAALDRGHGAAHLLDPRVATVVEHAFLHFDGERYRLHAWSVMPNHVHVIATPLLDNALAAIVHSWKSFTAKKANAILGREGAFWSREYFDRAVRDDRHYVNAVAYVEQNPVQARLCSAPEQWRFSSAWTGRTSKGAALAGSAGFQPALADVKTL